MEPNLNTLSVIRSDRPGQQFEMVVWRYANQNATVRVDRLGKLRRNVANRDVNKERPRWGDSGDVIQFAGDVWVPVDHDAAVAWMGVIDAFLEASPVQSSEPATAPDGSARAGLPNPTALARQVLARAESLRTQRKFLGTIGTLLQFYAWLQIVGSIILGIVLATYTREVGEGFRSETERPFVLQGIAAAISGIGVGVWMLVLGTLAVYVTARDGIAGAMAGPSEEGPPVD